MSWELWEKGNWERDNIFSFHIINKPRGKIETYEEHFLHRHFMKSFSHLQNRLNNGLLPGMHQPLLTGNQKLLFCALECSLFWFSHLRDTELPRTRGFKKYGSEIPQDVLLQGHTCPGEEKISRENLGRLIWLPFWKQVICHTFIVTQLIFQQGSYLLWICEADEGSDSWTRSGQNRKRRSFHSDTSETEDHC